MVRRIVLTGALLAIIPDSVVVGRLVAALLTSLAWLLLVLSCCPFVKFEDDVFAIISAFALTCIYLGALLVKQHADLTSGFGGYVNATLTSSVVDSQISSALGFTTTDEILTLTLTFTAIVMILAIVFLLERLANEARERRVILEHRLRYVHNQKLVEVPAIEADHFHLFLSHVWGSGQDQVMALTLTARRSGAQPLVMTPPVCWPKSRDFRHE